jgi:hypothetical protein
MQMNKQIIMILILASLLFSAIGAAFYFYKENREVIKNKNELVTIFIAKDDVKSNTLLDKSHLAKTQIAKQYILNKPLLKKEIIGKYVRDKIYKNEIFLKQNLNTKIEKSKAKILDYTSSSYNMKFELFQNPNITLVQGDFINIISVYPKDGEKVKKGEYTDYNVQYVATNLKVLGFIRDGRTESETITKHKIQVLEKKKAVEKIVDVKADELILDIQSNVLLNLVKDYTTGNLLWMVKTKESILIEPINKMEEKELIVAKKSIEKVTKKIVKVYKPKTYKFIWYKPTITKIQKSASIDYSGDKDSKKSKTKNVSVVINKTNLCSSIKDNLIIGTSRSFYIRDEASTKSKYKKLLYKNTIIPYLQELNHWYKTCDGLYISKNVVNKISYTKAISKVGKYGK